MRSIVYLWILFTLLCSRVAAATLHTDTFSTPSSTMEWAGGNPTPAYKATGGPAGAGDGYIEVVTSVTNFRLATYNFDARWTGDLDAVDATHVKASLMSPVGSAALDIRLVLFFSSPENSGQWTSSIAQSVPTDGVWRNYTFFLAEADVAHVTSDDAPYAEMIGNIDRVMLRHQPGSPDDQGSIVNLATLNIDNVQLAGTPPPVAGDFDGDFDVDNVDLTDPTVGFNARFGGNLQGADFLTWQRNYGTEPPLATVATNAVPEPSAWALPAFATATTWRRRGRGV